MLSFVFRLLGVFLLHFGSVHGFSKIRIFPLNLLGACYCLGVVTVPSRLSLYGILEPRALRARGDRIFVTSRDLPILTLSWRFVKDKSFDQGTHPLRGSVGGVGRVLGDLSTPLAALQNLARGYQPYSLVESGWFPSVRLSITTNCTYSLN